MILETCSHSLRKGRRAGFTLIELLVVISIVAVLAGLSLPVISNVKESGNSASCISNLKQIGVALDLFAADNNNDFPPLTTKDGVYAGKDWDFGVILPYLPGRNKAGQASQVENSIFVCPSAKYTGLTSANISRTYSSAESMIGYNSTNGSYDVWTNQRKRTNLASLPGTLLLFDGVRDGTNSYCKLEVPWVTLTGSADLSATAKTSTYIDYRHSKAFHALYADGHVDTIARAKASTVVTKTAWTGVAQ